MKVASHVRPQSPVKTMAQARPRFGEIKSLETFQEAVNEGKQLLLNKKPFGFLGIRIPNTEGIKDVLDGIASLFPQKNWTIQGNTIQKQWLLTDEDATPEALEALHEQVKTEHPFHEVVGKEFVPGDILERLRNGSPNSPAQ